MFNIHVKPTEDNSWCVYKTIEDDYSDICNYVSDELKTIGCVRKACKKSIAVNIAKTMAMKDKLLVFVYDDQQNVVERFKGM